VVTATGELISASAEQNHDLFWALRGGGGNFGVVTSFTFRLHPVEHVLAGAFTYPASKAGAALRLYRVFACECPDELTANGSLATTDDRDVTVSIAVCYAGHLARGEELLAPLRRLGPEVDAVGPMSYLALQQAPDEGFPSRQQHYWKSAYLTDLGDEVIDVMLDFGARMPSHSSGVGLQRLHGAAGRVHPTATAFPHRGDRYDCLILSQWPDPAQSDQNIVWTRELFAAIRPYLSGGVYVNNLGADEAERVSQAYGPNHGRLAAVKAAYDPANRFRHNHNVKPVTGITAPS
jgi:FAD/FMN-containing dehydrogenase